MLWQTALWDDISLLAGENTEAEIIDEERPD